MRIDSMMKNRQITSSAIAVACAFFLTSLTMSGMASAEGPIRAGQSGIANGNGECVAAWTAFTACGQTGVNGDGVSVLTVWNCDIIAGGTFTTAGGQTVNHIARWDGEAWHPFTSGGQTGVNGSVRAATVWNGDLIAGGEFTTAGGQTVNHIARWDGKAWHPFTSEGQVGVDGEVRALAVWNDDLIASGFFTTAGGQTVNRIARWDGEAWHPFTSGGQIGVAVGSPFVPHVDALSVYNGDLIAAGNFWTAGGQTVNRIARWDGSSWQPFSSGGQIGLASGSMATLTIWNGELIVGGTSGFTTAGGQTVNRIARWDGSVWHSFTSGGQIGVNNAVRALTVRNGDLIAAGEFTTAGGQTVNGIARWDGTSGGWNPFTSGGQIGVNNAVRALTVWNGDLIAGGTFATVGGQTVNHIARWDLCPPTPECPADLTGDDTVNVSDLLALLGCWGPVIPGGSCEDADFTCSGSVNVSDLLQLLSHWGDCP